MVIRLALDTDKEKLVKRGIWNIFALGNKESEIVNFMQKNTIKIMGISDSRRKGKGTKETHSSYVITWSGVQMRQRYVHGVAFILDPTTTKNLLDTEWISERIIKIRVKEQDRVSHYIQIYAPCNDSYSDEEKEEFFDSLAEIVDRTTDNEDLFVIGDFNGWVGAQRTPWEPHLRPFSDTNAERNYNAELLLNLCAEHQLFITNTFYWHRPTQVYMWYKCDDLAVASQIDFVLIRVSKRNTVNDCRAIPNAVLDTDHRPVITSITSKKYKCTKKKTQLA